MLPSHVRDALAGERIERAFTCARRGDRRESRGLLTGGVLFLVVGLTFGMNAAFDVGTITTEGPDGTRRELEGTERLLVGYGVLLAGLVIGSGVVAFALRRLRAPGPHVVLTPEALHEVYEGSANRYAWSEVRRVRRKRDTVILTLHPGRKAGRELHLVRPDDPDALLRACEARARA